MLSKYTSLSLPISLLPPTNLPRYLSMSQYCLKSHDDKSHSFCNQDSCLVCLFWFTWAYVTCVTVQLYTTELKDNLGT